MANPKIIDFGVRKMTRADLRGGLITVTRRLLFDPVVADDPVAFKLWLWILGMARFKDGKDLKRGQLKTSLEDLAKAARQTRGKGFVVPVRRTIQRVLDKFVDAEWITTSRSKYGVLITVLKYDEYQRETISVTSETGISVTSENPPQTLDDQGSAISGKPLVSHLKPGLVSTLEKDDENGRENPKKSIVKKIISVTSENPPQTRVNQGSSDPQNGISVTSENFISVHSENGDCDLEGRASTISDSVLVSHRLNNRGTEELISSKKADTPSEHQPKSLGSISAEQVHALYLEICPDLPRSRMTASLRTVINARFKESKEQRTMVFWHWFFSYVNESDFLCGRVKDFKANLAWLVGPKNFAKVMAGQYENREPVMPMPQTYREWCDYEHRMQVADVFRARFGGNQQGGGDEKTIDAERRDRIARLVEGRLRAKEDRGGNGDHS